MLALQQKDTSVMIAWLLANLFSVVQLTVSRLLVVLFYHSFMATLNPLLHSCRGDACRRADRHMGAQNEAIGFQVIKVEENREYRLKAVQKVVAKATYINSREVTVRADLPEGRFVVIPTTFDVGRETQFMLRIFTDHRCWARSLRRDVPLHKFYHGCLSTYPVVLAQVTCVSAAALIPQDVVFGGGADPYCVVKCEGTTSQTPIVKKTLSPIWQSSHVFFIKKPERCEITLQVCMKTLFQSRAHSWVVFSVQVWNWNLVKDEFMGQAKINTSEYMEAGKEGKTYEVSGRSYNMFSLVTCQPVPLLNPFVKLTRSRFLFSVFSRHTNS